MGGGGPCQLPRGCPINHSIAVQLGIPGAQYHTRPPTGQWDYFRGERLPQAGAQAAVPPSLNPSLRTQCAPASPRDLKQSGLRVVRGWQGLASLIQLAGPRPPQRNSGPTGACAPGSCSLYEEPMHMDTVSPFGTPCTSGTCGSVHHYPPTREGDRGLPRKVEELCGCL